MFILVTTISPYIYNLTKRLRTFSNLALTGRIKEKICFIFEGKAISNCCQQYDRIRVTNKFEINLSKRNSIKNTFFTRPLYHVHWESQYTSFLLGTNVRSAESNERFSKANNRNRYRSRRPLLFADQKGSNACEIMEFTFHLPWNSFLAALTEVTMFATWPSTVAKSSRPNSSWAITNKYSPLLLGLKLKSNKCVWPMNSVSVVLENNSHGM